MSTDHPKLELVRQWARREGAIRALVVTGSLARADGRTDQFSDLDLQVITLDIMRFTNDDRWLDELGEVWIRFPLNQTLPYRLVWFKDGVKVDFQFLSPSDIAPGALSDEYARGYHILLDKDNLFRDLPPAPLTFSTPPLPTRADVQAAVNQFWFEAIHVAQFIRRRDFWVVKHRDWTMKRDLLRLLEWHARATRPEPVNTRLLGRGLSSWADDESIATISGIWGGWAAQGLWDALFVQLKLFRRLSIELNQTLGYQYDDQIHRDIEAYIRQLWREDSDAGPRG